MSAQEYDLPQCSACCSDVVVQLTGLDQDQLEDAGTDLVTILPVMEGFVVDESEVSEIALVRSWSDVSGLRAIIKIIREADDPDAKQHWENVLSRAMEMRPGEGLFFINGKCGNQLPDKRCGNYAGRPRNCEEFQVGSTACWNFRREAAAPVPVAITKKQAA